MAGFNEHSTVQRPIVDLLQQSGWSYVAANALDRTDEQPFVESEIIAALTRLNPAVVDDPSRADEVLARLRMLTLTAPEEGLVQANRAFTGWLRGLETHQFTGTDGDVPVRLIDFDTLENNSFVVSQEVNYGAPGDRARFDIVLWVNGFPLVVGELKTAVDSKISWMKGAHEIHDVYEPQRAAFFTPNVFSFATEGKEFFYAGVRTPLQRWQAWDTSHGQAGQTGWARVARCVGSLLTPKTVLAMLASFTAFETVTTDTGTPTLTKLVARYPQFEAVNLIVDRVLDGTKRRGLIHHTQGSGKTLAMAFAAARLVGLEELGNPTIILIADRVQLVRQTYDQFRSAGMPSLRTPATAAELRALLSSDKRGVIFTTVHKFAEAGLLSTSGNIIVMIDEAHRTQEGGLGAAMRAALPNARFFGFTGTPIADADKNTYTLFSDPDDPAQALHIYNSDRSIADGMTLPIHVATRLVTFHLDKKGLDTAFSELATKEGLSAEEVEFLTTKVSRVATFFSNPARITAVCADIVEHFYSTVDPLGMKAQVVVVDRALCVAYVRELQSLLDARAEDDHPHDAAAVVMSVQSKDPAEFQGYALTDAGEEALLDRFRTFTDPLKFLVVTAKLGTGFDAPIEGVMYLDKPIRLHTLFQTITRTNRTWRNPATGQDKRYGLIADYIGLGDEVAKAMAPADPDAARRRIDLDGLLAAFIAELPIALDQFAGIDRTTLNFTTLQAANQRLPDDGARERFATRFAYLEGIWETCWPHPDLDAHKGDYKFLSKVYENVKPSSSSNEMLWHRLGAKTLTLVHSHIGEVTVTGGKGAAAVADADTIQTLFDEGVISSEKELKGKTAQDVLDGIAKRLRDRQDGPNGDHAVWVSLAERLDQLRERTLSQAQDSLDFLRDLFKAAKDLHAAEKVEDENGRDGLDLLPDPRIGALTQIFNEYAPKDTPVIVGRVVKDIDDIVKEVRYDGWKATQQGDRLVRTEIRKVLKRHALLVAGELFDRAYEYIAEHY